MRLTIKKPLYISGSIDGDLTWNEVGVKKLYVYGIRVPAGVFNWFRRRMLDRNRRGS